MSRDAMPKQRALTLILIDEGDTSRSLHIRAFIGPDEHINVSYLSSLLVRDDSPIPGTSVKRRTELATYLSLQEIEAIGLVVRGLIPELDREV